MIVYRYLPVLSNDFTLLYDKQYKQMKRKRKKSRTKPLEYTLINVEHARETFFHVRDSLLHFSPSEVILSFLARNKIYICTTQNIV